MRERPSVGIDCPRKMSAWAIGHVRKGWECVSFIEEGTHAIWRANVDFHEVKDDLLATIGRPNQHSPGDLWFRWTQDELEHALACYAYLRNGLNYWQANNLPWMSVTRYLSGRICEHNATQAGERHEFPQDPLPERDSSPKRRAKR